MLKPANRWLSWFLSSGLILCLLYLLVVGCDLTWFSLHKAPPAWDQGDHLTKAMNFWRVWQSEARFSSAWWTELWQQAPTQRAPLVYLFTVPFLALVGQSFPSAVYVNFLFTGILLVSVYFFGKHFFSSQVGIWAAVFCAIAPIMVFLRTDYLLDYPLAAVITFTYLSLTKWRDVNRRSHQWLWTAIAGFALGCCLLTRTSSLLFIVIPSFWLVGGTLWRRQWERCLQLLFLLAIAWWTISGWFTTNWLTIISTTLESNSHGAIYRSDPQANSLAGWLYYIQALPEMLSPVLLFACLGCWGIFIGRWLWQNFPLSFPLTKEKDRLQVESIPDINPNTNPNIKSRTWRWLAVLILGTYVLGSLGTNKQPRLLLPYLPILSVVLAYGFTLGKGIWWRGFRWLSIALATFTVCLHQFPISAGFGIVGQTHFPYTGDTYPHAEVIRTIQQQQPYLRSTLGVLTNTAELNPMNLDFSGASMGFQVYGRQIGWQPEQAEQDARSLNWYVTKTGNQGAYDTIEAGQVALKDKLERSADLQIVQQWKLPDRSELRLHRRTQLPIAVTPLIGKDATDTAAKDGLQLTSVNVPPQAPSGQPVPITYTWQGSWEDLKNSIVVLTWQQQNGSAYWIHDHAIGLGNLWQNLKSDPITGAFRVTESIAMLPPKSLPEGIYQLKATILNRKTEASLPLTIPSAQIQLTTTAKALPAPELDLLTQMRQLSSQLPMGKIDPVFKQLAIINQYDPDQNYYLQAEQSLTHRLQQISASDPNAPNLLYNLAFSYILQRKAPSAIATFTKITQVADPNNVWAWAYLGFVHLYSFQPQAAENALTKAAQLDPSLPILKTLRIVSAAMNFNLPLAWERYQAERKPS
jgi:4-amino-4-deoxy-L-arabinose transferase-like glycosyltransferase